MLIYLTSFVLFSYSVVFFSVAATRKERSFLVLVVVGFLFSPLKVHFSNWDQPHTLHGQHYKLLQKENFSVCRTSLGLFMMSSSLSTVLLSTTVERGFIFILTTSLACLLLPAPSVFCPSSFYPSPIFTAMKVSHQLCPNVVSLLSSS